MPFVFPERLRFIGCRPRTADSVHRGTCRLIGFLRAELPKGDVTDSYRAQCDQGAFLLCSNHGLAGALGSVKLLSLPGAIPVALNVHMSHMHMGIWSVHGAAFATTGVAPGCSMQLHSGVRFGAMARRESPALLTWESSLANPSHSEELEPNRASTPAGPTSRLHPSRDC